MISVEEALEKVLSYVDVLEPERILSDSCYHTFF